MCCEYCYIKMEHEHIMMDNETCMYLQLKQPDIEGSGIIIPKQHRETVFDLTDEEWQDTFALLQEVKMMLDADLQPDGYNVGWNSGSVGGQHIFHAHLHVIPRFADEPYAGKGSRHWLKSKDNQRPVTR